MSAVADIRAALDAGSPSPRGHERVLLVGLSARLALPPDLLRGASTVTTWRGASARIERTDQFPGWEIVERKTGQPAQGSATHA